MENLSMCRICLATDVRLCSLASHLRVMYERITAMTFKREDWRPLVACYICHARLQNCYRLRTSCLQSEERLIEMMSSGVLTLQDVLSTNTFRVVSALHLSLGDVVLDNTECDVKEEAPEIKHDAELDQHNIEDIITEAQEEQCTVVGDNKQCSHLEDPLDVIKRELDDVETGVEDLELNIEDTILQENDNPNDVGLSSQLAHNICPKTVKLVLQRIDLNDTGRGTTDSKKNKIVTEKNTDDATTNKRKIEVTGAKIVTWKPEVKKLVTTNKILGLCDKLYIKLNKCENVVTSIVNNVCEESTNNRSLKHDVSSISITKYNQFSCDTCKKCFSFKNQLISHICINSGNKPYQCNDCKKCFIHQHAFNRHKSYQCDVCKKCFINKSRLKTHSRTHTGEKPYQCEVCKICFSQKGHLNTHIRIHTGEKPYRCNFCGKCFIQKWHLDSHSFKHTGEKPYQCNVCNKYFGHKSLLKTHTRKHTGEKKILIRRNRIHTGEKKILIRRNRRRTGEKPHQCDVCGKCFTSKGFLNIHSRTHTGEKPYQCNFCEKCFIQKSVLINHIRTHTGEKPYQCHVCKKKFSQKSDLERHILTHSGNKPYECDVCNKCFTLKSNLKKHSRIHTGEKRYECDVCKKCFVKKSQVKIHIYSHHNKK